MNDIENLQKLRISWTKYSVVQCIDIIAYNEFDSYLRNEKITDLPVLKGYLGITEDGTVPEYWYKIKDYPAVNKLFVFLTGLFTHIENIDDFSTRFAKSNGKGVFEVLESNKKYTNLRSALVESGASPSSYRNKKQVPYDFTPLFETAEIGKLFKEHLANKLKLIGFAEAELNDNFYEICYRNNFHVAISLDQQQFKDWLEGKALFKQESGTDFKAILPSQEVSALKINQWLTDWEKVDFTMPQRRKPEPFFYFFSIDIRILKRLSDVHRRSTTTRRNEESSAQRPFEPSRSQEIQKYVKHGFPCSTKKTITDAPTDLLMPGLLPTAIIANIIGKDEERAGKKIDEEDIIQICVSGDTATLTIPQSIYNEDWNPAVKPIEIIDGQHRLMAFEEDQAINGKFEIPVIAFNNLDRAWQAYLFYVINIKPKRINTSLGYDLYPLMRSQKWLENTKDGLKVYREARAQEIVEALWLYEGSPWFHKINMIGASNSEATITQASFVRALLASFFQKRSGNKNGGIFLEDFPDINREPLSWNRAQQAALIIMLWTRIQDFFRSYIEDEKIEWITKCYPSSDQEQDVELFNDKNLFLARDQGVNAILKVVNDLLYKAANKDYKIFESYRWEVEMDDKQITPNSIDSAIQILRRSSLMELVDHISEVLAKYDWRTSSAHFADDEQDTKERKKRFKGSGGYKELRNELLSLFSKCEHEQLAQYSESLTE